MAGEGSWSPKSAGSSQRRVATPDSGRVTTPDSVFERIYPAEEKRCSCSCKLGFFSRVCLAVLAFVCLAVACGLLVKAGLALRLLRRTTLCQCKVTDFQATQTYVQGDVVPPTCDTMLGLVVRSFCPNSKHTLFFVQKWMPEFTVSYRSSTGVAPLRPEFSCCPPGTADMCAFQDLQTESFCDDWGSVRAGCPRAPWACYFLDLDEKMLQGSARAEDIQVGNIGQDAWAFLGVGLVLLVAGIVSLLVLTYSHWQHLCKRRAPVVVDVEVKKEDPAAARRAYFRAKAVPEALRSKKMQEYVENYAAKTIQRIARGYIVRRQFFQLVHKLIKEGRVSLKVLVKRRRKGWDLDDEPDPVEQTRRIATRFQRRGIAKELRMPSSRGPSPRHGFLYDTGSTDTFRRTTCTRMLSAPGEELLRIELALTEPARALEGLFRVTDPSAGSRLVVARQPPAQYADLNGLRRGHRVVKVGELEWPQCTGTELLEALRCGPRPLFLVCEALPEELFEGPEPPLVPKRMRVVRPLPPPLHTPDSSASFEGEASGHLLPGGVPLEGSPQTPVFRDRRGSPSRPGSAGPLRSARSARSGEAEAGRSPEESVLRAASALGGPRHSGPVVGISGAAADLRSTANPATGPAAGTPPGAARAPRRSSA